MILNLEEQHKQCLYPEVRIIAGAAAGSGTVIFCEPTPDEEGMWDAYVVTNEHVVDGLIEIKKKWNPVLKREIKSDFLGHPDVEVFRYAYLSRKVGASSYQADIVAYDKELDLALLMVRSPTQFKHIADMYPENMGDVKAFMPVWNVGCGLGGPPAITAGFISAFGIDIENEDYMLVTAPSIFGNSGGGTFLQETGQFIGIPARISVVLLGWSADAVTHLGFSIPIERVYRFLREQVFDFIFDETRTSKHCEEDREAKRKQDLLRRIDAEGPASDNINPQPSGQYW